VLCYTRGSSLMSWKNKNGLSKVHTSTPYNRNAVWLISREGHAKDILLLPISKMKVQPHVDEPPRSPRHAHWGISW
jgi:hypothetical protein